MRPTGTIRTISRRAATAGVGVARLLPSVIGRRGSGPVLALVLVLAVAAQGYLAFEPKLADSGEPTGRPVSAAELRALQTAALSCPTLSAPRLAGQVMASSGFDAETVGKHGARGLAGLELAEWRKWQPWPDAAQADPQANIVALAHETCEMVGELRAADVPGDLWRAAVAATRVGADAVVAVKGVPASAQTYVDEVNGYADWYAKQPEFGGSDTATPEPLSADANAPAAKPLPKEYVDDVLKAGRICSAVTPARVAALLMADSGFDPNKRSASGAQGIAQFLPAVWSAYAGSTDDPNASPWDPATAIPMLGATMCDLTVELSALTSGDPFTLALAAFQWGATAVRQAGGVPQSSTLQDNADQVLSYVGYYEKDPRLNPAARQSGSASPSHSPSPSHSASPSPSRKPGPKYQKIVSGHKYQIKNAFTGMVLGLQGDGSKATPGLPVQQEKNARVKEQYWYLVKDDHSDYYWLLDARNLMAMSVQDGSKSNGARIVEGRVDVKNPVYQWSLERTGKGGYWIVNRATGKALDVLGDDLTSGKGGPINQWDRQDYAKDQRWLIVK